MLIFLQTVDLKYEWTHLFVSFFLKYHLQLAGFVNLLCFDCVNNMLFVLDFMLFAFLISCLVSGRPKYNVNIRLSRIFVEVIWEISIIIFMDLAMLTFALLLISCHDLPE